MSTATASQPVNAVPAAQGEAVWLNGALMEVKLPEEWSGDAFSLVEVAMEGGRATELHTDSSEETFYILDGEPAPFENVRLQSG